jgi:hypothetical protein
MKEYYYMFSRGSYSDYCVGDLYKSTEELSEEYFINHLKLMLLDQVKDWPEAVEYINALDNDLSVLGGWSLQRRLFALVAGECPDYQNREGQTSWSKAYEDWVKDVGEIDKDFVKSLVTLNILESVEYEEIWERTVDAR